MSCAQLSPACAIAWGAGRLERTAGAGEEVALVLDQAVWALPSKQAAACVQLAGEAVWPGYRRLEATGICDGASLAWFEVGMSCMMLRCM